ncbi:hypothetical protein BJF83_00400 [Nocardiopsis sp. CNR-923]|uniref:hypothetical protein n=1 Tax=Nocardiopsis sp. CNR-923 TaxID=1904965 RepID=UPI000964DE9D|nr:hypothetical protein [Nocardiopsis sp. CNR-923]OLT29123.1 hypothetical protein BJF83_00400 [Nocardiopsis sp. CNR-923]
MENTTARLVHPFDLAPDDLRAEADALACEEAPHRFAVFALDEAEQDGVILAWGLRFGNGRVVLVGDGAPIRGTFGSLRSALRVCAYGGAETYVAWVDPEPDPAPED